MGTCAAIENTNRNRNYNRKIHSSHKHSNHHNYNDDTNSNKNNNMSSQNDDDDNDDDIIDNNLISNDIQNISNDNNNSNSNNTSNNNDDISENDYSDNDNNNSINNMNDYNSLYKQNYSHFNKVKLISNPHSIYLQCPNCKSNTLLISHIYYNETQTEYYITYICPCSKVSNKEISIPLKSTLTRELPYQYCKEHKTNILNYYCLDCQVPLCEECKYKYHVTKTVKHILISSKDIYVNHLHKESSKRIRAKLNVLKDKEKAFDLVIEEQKQLLTNEFDKLIQRLKTIKNEYEKEMIEKYHHIKHIFTFVRTLYENYLNNVSNNAIDEFPICSLSHLEYMNLMFDNNNNYSEQIHKMASRAITTNIFDIVGETELPKRRLMFRYDFNFHKQKYNPFDYNYLYYRKGDNDDEYNVNNYNYKQSEQHSIEKEDDVIDNDNDNDNENNNTVNNKVIYNNNNKQIIKINTHSNQIQQQVIKVSEQNEIEIHPTIHSNSHQMQMQIQPQTVIKKDISNLSFPLECKNTLQGHQNKVITIIFLSSLCSSGQGYKLASGGCDNTIKIWDSQYDISSFHYEIEKTLIETNNVLTLLEFEPNLLLSGTAGNVINLWSLYTNQKLYTFIEHKLWVNCLIKLTNNHFASCSNDSKIIVWNYSSKTKEGEMAEHSDCVLTMILLDNNNICSGSADNSIKMWNWNECKCIMNMLGHEQWVKCLCQMENGDIVSGSDDKTIKVWRNGCCIRTIQGHEDAVRTVCVYQRKYLLSGGFDCSIRVWDVKNEWKCLQVTKEHNANVICIIKRDDVGIVSCSNDNTIKLWKWNYEGN